MHRLMAMTMLLVWSQTLAGLRSFAAQDRWNEARELLRNRVEAAGIPPKMDMGEEIIHASTTLPRFYERRAYQPAWFGKEGPLPRVDALIRAIHEADREGLRPTDYHLIRIEARLGEICPREVGKRTPSLPSLVDLDLLLTDAFLIYGSHLLAGRVNPETFDSEWHANRREVDLSTVLLAALDSNRIEEALKHLLPPQMGYLRLRQALERYRDISAKGGWPIVSTGPKLQKGDRDERIMALRARLISSADLEQQPSDEGDFFDDALDQALRRFQPRHGLVADGVVGPATLAALNVPVKERIRQIEFNLERWRWLPQNLGKRHVLVNIASFELGVVENDETVLVMRVVVGMGYRRTPVFSDDMTYLVLCPYWHVPPNIAIQDKLPLIHRDPAYLTKQRIKVFQGWGADAQEIDPATIDWSKVTPENFVFSLRQDPGPWNALGRVKFMFPNKFNVYLHDTPTQELFSKATRTFSSGCIRIENPIELAEYVMTGDPNWTRERIVAALETNIEQTVPLPEHIPVHLLYWTAWVDEGGSIQFRDDIYGRDKLLDRALREKPPGGHPNASDSSTNLALEVQGRTVRE